MKQTLEDCLEHMIEAVKDKLEDREELKKTFENCYRNTLQKTVKKMKDGTTYVITGDIPAMWLRDSTAQMRPYLIPARESEELADLIQGLIQRQFSYVLMDAYANAFNESKNGACWEQDETEKNDWVWERKYEIDSLCYPVQLAYLFWKNTGRTKFFNTEIKKGFARILKVFKTEQNHEKASSYRFIRRNSYFTDTLSREGMGAYVKQNIGLTWSGFRPSDDACVYGYLIPSNMFAVVILKYMAQIAEEIYEDIPLKEKAECLSEEIQKGIETYGITKKEGFGEVYAYEVDGFGQFNLMDDANVPSLLSMEYLGYHGTKKEVAENTRRLILSEANPYYYTGEKASGIGSSHTPVRYIWHIALAMQGLTEVNREEKLRILEILSRTDGKKGMMHEGFHADNSEEYTREWFSWANALFSELVMEYCGFTLYK